MDINLLNNKFNLNKKLRKYIGFGFLIIVLIMFLFSYLTVLQEYKKSVRIVTGLFSNIFVSKDIDESLSFIKNIELSKHDEKLYVLDSSFKVIYTSDKNLSDHDKKTIQNKQIKQRLDNQKEFTNVAVGSIYEYKKVTTKSSQPYYIVVRIRKLIFRTFIAKTLLPSLISVICFIIYVYILVGRISKVHNYKLVDSFYAELKKQNTKKTIEFLSESKSNNPIEKNYIDTINQIRLIQNQLLYQDNTILALEKIIMDSTDLIIKIDSEGKILRYNFAAQSLLNKINHTKNIFDLFSERNNIIIKKIISNEIDYETQIKIRNRLYKANFMFMNNESDVNNKDMIIIFKYFNDNKKLLDNTITFFSNLSHELKTPLQSILGNVDLIQNLSLSKKDSKESVEEIKNAANKMKTIIFNMLDISSIDNISVDRIGDIEKVFLKGIFKKAIKSNTAKIEEKNLTYTITGDAHIVGDVNHFDMLANNLISNAVKYNKQNGHIFIDIKKTHSYVVVTIKDTGIGVETNEIDKITNSFYRSNNISLKDEIIEGTGIGLSIVDKIVYKYKGDIKIDSTIGVGSTFTIRLKDMNADH